MRERSGDEALGAPLIRCSMADAPPPSLQSLPLTPPALHCSAHPLDHRRAPHDAFPTLHSSPPSPDLHLERSHLFAGHTPSRSNGNPPPPPPRCLSRIQSSLSSQDPKYRRALSRILPRSPSGTPTVFSAEEDAWRGDFLLSHGNRHPSSSQLRPNSKSFLAFLFNARKTRHTRNLLLLILLNLAYLTAEFSIGLYSGRVGLVSDAFHLSFGCGVLTLSLYAMFMSKNSHDDIYTYGYKRLEVLAAFTNTLFLLFLSFSLVVEALHAFIQDESEHKHYLIVSAVTNLMVNLLGVWFFRSYGRIHIVYMKAEDMNHHSICLHVLSDSIRSAGLILASWLLTLGVKNAETLCLGLTAVAIFLIVMPLFKAAAGMLLQMAPSGISASAFNKCLRQVAVLEDVIECFQARFWDMVPGYVVGTLILKVKQGADEQKILKHVHSIYNEIGIKDLTVQIDIEH